MSGLNVPHGRLIRRGASAGCEDSGNRAMGISITRFSVAAVVVLQWVAIAVLVHLGHSYQHIFADFRATLPGISIIALQATQPIVLVPIAVITTAIVVVAEALLQSATYRSAVQALVLFLWLAFTCFCLIAIEMPLVTILKNIS
jgi:hypothetical protein